MGILERFSDIVKANVNAVLDKMEDPSKMIDQYIIDLSNDLAEVKKETASVMAEEARTRRMLEENQAEVQKYAGLAEKALKAGNEDDARVFIGKKQQVEQAGEGLKKAYDLAKANAEKMRQMHDKLVSDLESLNARRNTIKATVSVARTQEKLNNISSSSDRAQAVQGSFARMEDKANRMLDEATAMSELNTTPPDEAASLEEKYSGSEASVDDELAAMKAKLGL